MTPPSLNCHGKDAADHQQWRGKGWESAWDPWKDRRWSQGGLEQFCLLELVDQQDAFSSATTVFRGLCPRGASGPQHCSATIVSHRLVADTWVCCEMNIRALVHTTSWASQVHKEFSRPAAQDLGQRQGSTPRIRILPLSRPLDGYVPVITGTVFQEYS